RVRIDKILRDDPFFVGQVKELRPHDAEPGRANVEILRILEMLEELTKLEPAVQSEHLALLRSNLSDPGHFADLVANVLNLEPTAQVRVLESVDVEKRLAHVAALVREQLEFARVVRETDLKVRDDIE